MTRPKPPTVQVVNEYDEPYLLVRAETADEARELAQRWLAQHGDDVPWYGETDDGQPLTVTPVRDGWHRWTPRGNRYSDYDRLLEPAGGPGPGAFHAWDVEVGAETRAAI